MTYSDEIKKHKDKFIIALFITAFVLYFAYSLTCFQASSQEIRNDVVRLHILANSNSEADQSLKLKVRDELLKKNTSLLTKGVTKENVCEYFNASKDELTKTATETVLANGFDYGAKITLCKEYYPTREYGELTFPAGVYTSVKVVLGEGKGHNWWCVMFPPLCVPSAFGEISENKEELDGYICTQGEKILSSGKKYKVKFKIVEIYEALFK